MAGFGPRWNAEQLAGTNAGKLTAALAQAKAKPRKYRNEPIEFDGYKFDSKKEAKRYQTLSLLEAAGKILLLRVHPTWRLLVSPHFGSVVAIGDYEADFSYVVPEHGAAGKLVIEDVKSVATKTELYRWKRRHVEAQYGVTVTEV